MFKERIAVFFLVFGILGVVLTAIIGVDLILNPWLHAASNDWGWWNYFTTHHGLAMFWIKHRWAVIGIYAGFSSVVTYGLCREK